MFNTTSKKRITQLLLMNLVLILVMVIVPQLIGLGKGGFDFFENLQQYFFYISTGGVLLLGLNTAVLISVWSSKLDKEYGNSVGFVGLGGIFDIGFFKRFTHLQLGFLSFIIFSILGLFTALRQGQAFTGVGVLEQGFTAVDNIIYSLALVPIPENLGLALIISATIIFVGIIARKYKWGRLNYVWVSATLSLIFASFYGWALHILRYGGSDISLSIVLLFWTVGTLITILIGSFVPFWMLHVTNNLYVNLSSFLSSEAMVLYIIIIDVVLIFIYAIIYRGRLLGERQPEEADI